MELEYYIDYMNRRIHLLDKSYPSTPELLNVITPEFQKQFIENECLLIDVLDFDWFIYASNGIIFSYSAYRLELVNPEEKTLYKPFMNV